MLKLVLLFQMRIWCLVVLKSAMFKVLRAFEKAWDFFRQGKDRVVCYGLS